MTRSAAKQQEKENLKMVRDGDFLVIQKIKNPSEAVQLVAVKKNFASIQFIKKPSDTVRLVAVSYNGWAIEYIKNPSEAVQLAAVGQNGKSIQYIENPSEAVQMAAVGQDGWAILYIRAAKRNGWGFFEVMTGRQKQDHQMAAITAISDAVQIAAFVQAGPFVVGKRKCFDPRNFPILAIANAFQSVDRPFNFCSPVPDDEKRFYKSGLSRLALMIGRQPSADILVLAAAAPGLFENNVLTKILRDALLENASPARAAGAKRLM